MIKKMLSKLETISFTNYLIDNSIKLINNLLFKKTGFKKKMNVNEAKAIFNINKLDKNEINKRYNQLIFKNHPDMDGSEYLMSKINEAKQILTPRSSILDM